MIFWCLQAVRVSVVSESEAAPVTDPGRRQNPEGMCFKPPSGTGAAPCVQSTAEDLWTSRAFSEGRGVQCRVESVGQKIDPIVCR